MDNIWSAIKKLRNAHRSQVLNLELIATASGRAIFNDSWEIVHEDVSKARKENEELDNWVQDYADDFEYDLEHGRYLPF